MTQPTKTYSPTSPGRRAQSVIAYRQFITKKNPEKSLTFGRKRISGRNNQGRITTRHRGGGAKRLFRAVDFKQNKYGVTGRVLAIEYDPNRTSFLALVLYSDGERRYILAPEGLKVGGRVLADEKAPLEVGSRLPLAVLPVGTFIHNIELQPRQGGVLVRSAGSGGLVLAQEGDFTNIKMPSGEVRRFLSSAWASMGVLSNPHHRHVGIGKAGRARHMGRRPTVRGSAMNPRDHPLGGGEGRTMRGMARVKNKWGKPVRGVKTRKRGKYSDKLILQRRK